MGFKDREDNCACNPMLNSLPREVTSRRKAHVSQAEKEGDEVTLDRKVVFLMKPEFRAKWLTNALNHVKKQKIRSSDIYEILASNRFVDGIQPKLGRKMAAELLVRLELFSVKQRKKLSSEADLMVKFGSAPAPTEAQQPSPESGGSADDMLTRCAAFMREKMIERGELAAVVEGGAQACDSAAAPDTSKAEKPEKTSGSAEAEITAEESLKKITKGSSDDAKRRKTSKARSGSSDVSSRRNSKKAGTLGSRHDKQKQSGDAISDVGEKRKGRNTSRSRKAKTKKASSSSSSGSSGSDAPRSKKLGSSRSRRRSPSRKRRSPSKKKTSVTKKGRKRSTTDSSSS